MVYCVHPPTRHCRHTVYAEPKGLIQRSRGVLVSTPGSGLGSEISLKIRVPRRDDKVAQVEKRLDRMDAMEATRASPAPKLWRGGCQGQSPRTDCWRRKGPQTFRAGCFLNRALRGASSVSRAGSSNKASRMRLGATRLRAAWHGSVCACRKDCDTDRPKVQMFVSNATDGSLPEGLVRHKLVLDSDGVGSMAVPALYLH